MIPIPGTFKAGGNECSPPFNFKLIERRGDIALSEKSKTFPKMKGRLHPAEFVTYEVVIVQKMGDHTWPNGNFTPAHEHMPSDESWGEKGWSLQTKDRAWEKFREVCSNGTADGLV